MKKYFLIILSASYLLLLFVGCQSAKKSFKKGDFDESVLFSVEKLKSNPGHTTSIEILKQAYPIALSQHTVAIRKAKESLDAFKWEPVWDSYKKLNELYDAIDSCPECRDLVHPRQFTTEEKAARQNAVAARYKEAEKLIADGSRISARKAYDHYERAQYILPGYNDVVKKLDLAYELAAFNVVVEQVMVTSKTYQLSNEYFQERVNEYLQMNRKLNKFVRFYTPEEATEIRLRPDHVITLQFDDFVVGQMVLEKNTETFTSKDSVVVEEKVVGRTKVPVYARVKAIFTQNRKVVHSAGLLDMQIKEFSTQKIVNQEKFNGEYNWICEWAHFNGDERALTPAQLRKCKSQELHPPVAQDLFIEFSKPIYERLTSTLKNFYAKY
ncbi:hypothetical protein [Dyadobacter sandarakinus]|uniref:Lipoprotein n=1 Tax=Dyadobacter sandarakinus TaxID=2747268 RepID=A0ABX7IDJ7_9BACT|nr:hypothetical protein [Dyadobacter sandarakinus]QRR03577.1 hypothetical protein HWI92_23005 [Dyadobacter sandarakinus]